MLATDPAVHKKENISYFLEILDIDIYLGNIDLSGVHELENGSQMVEWNIFENDDGVFGRVLFQQVLEVGGTSAENHLVSLGVLTLGSNGHITERLLVTKMLEGCHHIGLKVVPSQTELLIVSRHLGSRLEVTGNDL